MKQPRVAYIIHLFALAHAIVCTACALFGLPDTTLLTLLTMVMTVMICTRRQVQVEFTALAIILVNLGGFLLGTLGALCLDRVIPAEWDWISHTVSTLVTTEVIGWILERATVLSPHSRRKAGHRNARIGLLILAIAGVFLLRMSMNLISQGFYIRAIVTNPVILTELLAFLLVMVFSAILYGAAMNAREKSRMADMRYATLKNLVNPHFLFNSLNNLDGLIPPENEAAKNYLHRLAALYRYMTVHEGEALVPLSDEGQFAKNYMNLMRVRFPGAIETSVTVRDEELNTKIVPCSIQILLENAVKHNAFSPEHPLRITVTSEEGWFIVRNNVRPRTSPPASTGVGIHYIQSRYKDLSERDIQILQDEESFTVRVPLIK